MRSTDWSVKLNQYILNAQKRVFKYGEFDCCIFVADAVKEMTGIDFMEEFRGKYDTIEGGNLLLETVGKGSLYDTLVNKFGDPVPGVYGTKGDIAFYEDCCGLILGNRALFCGEAGMILLPIRKIRYTFKV